MAKLDKLQIYGIRSFGPYDEQALRFNSPVTLILGQNGSGKTTIIESIKYACTGEVPGGTNNGQGFVSDPKISGTSSTKGQVKLKFTDPRDNVVTVSRVAEVTQSSLKMTFKSISSAIKVVDPNGIDRSLTNRCADLTAECCQLMNVSPAVINNVIFCHQEHSSWPLDEAKKLKERFDDIFDAQKYNKCSDGFRRTIKARQSRLKIIEVELVHKFDQKRLFERETQKLQETEERLQTSERSIASKKAELQPIQNRLNEIFVLEEELSKLQNSLTERETTKKGIIDQQNTIKQNLSFEFNGSDDELKSKIRTFEGERQIDEKLISELDTKRNSIENKQKDIVQAKQQVQTQFGKLNEKKDNYQDKCSRRKVTIEKARNSMNVDDLNSLDDISGVKDAILELNNELENQQFSLVSLIHEAEVNRDNLQKLVDSANEKKISMTEICRSKENEVKVNEEKIDHTKNQLDELSISDEYIGKSIQKISFIDKTLSKLKETFRENEETQKLEEYKKTINNLEANLATLESDHRLLVQNDVVEGKMESEKRIVLEKQKEISKFKNLHSNSLRELFDGRIPERNLKEAVLEKQQNADVLTKNLTEKITLKQKEVTTLEVRKQHQIDKVKNCEIELKLNRNKISQVCNGGNFNEILKDTFGKKERLQLDKGQYNSVRIIYGKFVKNFEKEKPCCPVCESDFTGKKNIVQRIISTLKSKIDRVPQELTRVESELEKEEQLYGKLQQLQLVNKEVEEISTEKLPLFKRELIAIEQELEQKKQEMEELKLNSKRPMEILEICKRLISDVSTLYQNQLDVDKSQKTIDTLKRSLIQVASNKSKQEVEAEIEHVKSQVAELRHKIETNTKKINSHKDRLQLLLQERTTLMENQIQLKENLQNQPTLERQLIELEQTVSKLKDKIRDLKLELQQQEEKLRVTKQNKDSGIKNDNKMIEEQRKKIAEYRKDIEYIENLQKEIDDYLTSNAEQNLVAAEAKIKELTSKEKQLEDTKLTVVNAISEKKENLAKEELRFRTLKDNLLLREKSIYEKSIDLEIESLKKQIGGFNYRTVHAEKMRLNQQNLNFEKEINQLNGEKTVLVSQVEDLRTELNKPEKKKAYANYMAKYYEKKIAQKIIKDLLLYVAALDKAVVDFHKTKMVQINRTIRDLWRNTYRGNDIDYIEIKTEFNAGTAQRRSYDYKVVQIKKGVEIDMRGRCSAGQKVLACLIIRMALAETMSTNCGILALDEPTTNLDKANILSLCDTLTKIINTRQTEQSFQLIIITHDEEFLNALSRVQAVSCFYRVQRNHDGFSTIERENIGY